MRPTFLEFRSPKEKTPGFYSPQVTCVGKSLGFVRGSDSKTFSQSKRFQQYEVDAKRTPFKVGPGCYSSCSLDLTKASIGGPIYKSFQVGKKICNNGYFYTGNNLVFEKAFVHKSRKSSTESFITLKNHKKPKKNLSFNKKLTPNQSSRNSKNKKRPASAKPRPY